MMGIHQPQASLFSYQVNLDKRVRADHPLRRVVQTVDFDFVRAEVSQCYGDNGNESGRSSPPAQEDVPAALRQRGQRAGADGHSSAEPLFDRFDFFVDLVFIVSLAGF